MTDFFQYLLTPFQYFSELGLGAMLASALAGVISFTGNVSNLLGANVTGPNNPPHVVEVRIAESPYGPHVNHIDVGPEGKQVYVHGTVADGDGCQDIDAPGNIQIGPCTSATGYCLSVSSGSATVDQCTLGEQTARYQSTLFVQPVPISAGTTAVLDVPSLAHVIVRDDQGADNFGEAHTVFRHPGIILSGSSPPSPSVNIVRASGESASEIPVPPPRTSTAVPSPTASPVSSILFPRGAGASPTAVGLTTRTTPTPVTNAALPTSIAVVSLSTPEPVAEFTSLPTVKGDEVPAVLGSSTQRKTPRALCTWWFCIRY